MNMSKLIVWIFPCLFLSGVLATSPNAWPAETTGQDLFEKRCIACHKLPDPGQSPSAGWEQQLELMAPLARLKGEQKQDVLAYLLSHTRDAALDASLEEDKVLFEQKCSLCHTLDRILLSPLEGEALGHVINRMQSRSGTDWLSDQEVERVLDYLSELPRQIEPKDLGDAAGPGQIFAARCSACHTLERVFDALNDSEDDPEFWAHTVSRMRGKSPQWMSETEADEILSYLRNVASNAP